MSVSFGLKWSLSGKCFGFWNLPPQDGRWERCHGNGKWSQWSSCKLLAALWVLTGLAGPCPFPVLLALAQLASAAGNLRLFSLSLVMAWWAFLLTQLVLCSPPRSGYDSHLHTGLGYPCPQGRFALPWEPLWWTDCPTSQLLPVPSLEHPGTSEYFLYKRGDSRKLTQSLSQLNHDFALIWPSHAGYGKGTVLCKTVSPQRLRQGQGPLCFWYLWLTDSRVSPMIPTSWFSCPCIISSSCMWVGSPVIAFHYIKSHFASRSFYRLSLLTWWRGHSGNAHVAGNCGWTTESEGPATISQ